MTHNLAVGQTLSGKTTLMMKLAKNKRIEKERPIIVLDKHLDPKWEADYITDDKEKFLEVVKSNVSCEVIIDESGEAIGKYAKEMMFLATSSRHRGHVATFIVQRTQMLDRNITGQCTQLYVFSLCKKDAIILSEDWNEPELAKAWQLEQGEFFYKRRHKPVIKANSFTLDI